MDSLSQSIPSVVDEPEPVMTVPLVNRYVEVFKAVLSKPQLNPHDILFIKTMIKSLAGLIYGKIAITTVHRYPHGRSILEQLSGEDVSFKNLVTQYTTTEPSSSQVPVAQDSKVIIREHV